MPLRHAPGVPDPTLRPADGLWALLVFLGLAVALDVLLPLPRSLAHATPEGLVTLYAATVAAEGGAVALVLARHGRLRAFLAAHYSWHRRSVSVGVLWGLGLSLLATALTEAERPWLPIHSNNPFVADPATAHLPLAILAALILLITVGAPLAEEALFRGLLFGGWRVRWGFWPAAIGSALLFGLAHGQAALLVPLATVGLGLATLAARSGSLWPSTAAHATFNLVAIVAALGFR